MVIWKLCVDIFKKTFRERRVSIHLYALSIFFIVQLFVRRTYEFLRFTGNNIQKYKAYILEYKIRPEYPTKQKKHKRTIDNNK